LNNQCLVRKTESTLEGKTKTERNSERETKTERESTSERKTKTERESFCKERKTEQVQIKKIRT
jgi:hypothetical protein